PGAELGFVVRVKSNGHALRGAALRRLRDKVGSCAGSSPPGKSRTPTPREALLLSEPVLVETASVLSSGSTRPAAYTTDRVSSKPPGGAAILRLKERIFRGLHLRGSECIAPCPLSATRLAPPLLPAYRRASELLLLSKSAGSHAADWTSALL